MRIPEWRARMSMARGWWQDWHRGIVLYLLVALWTAIVIYGVLHVVMPCVTWTETCAEQRSR